MIRIGHTVRLPDGDTGRVVRLRGDFAHVLHVDGRTLGRGPWIVRIDQLERVRRVA